jgi:DNA/RNA-binding domain of Phe-tRNA-synthetase-like protein
MRELGASPRDFPTSVESLLRRAMRGGAPFTINPLVDFYNAVSLKYVVPAGGVDIGQVRGPLELRFSREGDTFQALDASAPGAVPVGELAYVDGSTLLTRHFVWKQSRVGLIGPQTTEALLVAEILQSLDRSLAATIGDEFKAGLENGFRAETRAFTMDERLRVASW